MESITSHIAEFISLINFNKTSLYRSVIITCLIPFTWNVIARNEYKYQSFSKFFPSRRFANYVLAFSIFTSSLYRDYLFKIAVDEQSEWAVLHQVKFLSIPLFLVGNVLVLSSMWKLGVSGTYLGDYFGICK
ncbi:Phosphatidyl-N-methylethanolamine N-methyltransferase [Lobulomyces angularis]|nr:Phosphatidyl-N-methylethanolamine N-methyltransferase [Lobulomyces angularis]